MRLKLIQAPMVEPVSLDEAKGFLRVDSADDNALISALITAAREFVEVSTLRALITQTWEMALDGAGQEIRIPRPPLQTGIKIETVDEAGVKTEVDPAIYDVELGQGSPGRVRLRSGCAWPAHRGFASFIVTFKAGYGDAADAVPGALREALFRVLGHFYEGRQGEDLPAGVQALMRPYKVIYL
jgi:uncharacterized phiE125 gp8 family phage protein